MGGFCEKMPEPSPMSDKASARRLQDGPAAHQSDGGSTSVITHLRSGGKNPQLCRNSKGERSETM